jgi:hypothetical protein
VIEFTRSKSNSGVKNMNINSIMKQAKQMQSKMMQIQEKLAEEKVEATVGGGMVSATFTGQGDIVSIKIDPEVINPDDKEMLEDLVVSAVSEGLKKSRELMSERMGGLTGALGAMGMGL